MRVIAENTTDYPPVGGQALGNFVYQDEELSYILFPEGRIVLDNTITFNYFISDHLGNNCALISQNGNLLQENHYYPFGMQINALSHSTAEPDNNYLYNGKELQPNFGLDWYEYGARNYDPQIARWSSVDAMAEEYLSWSPYNYTMNNPIRFVDPNGMWVDDPPIDGKKISLNASVSVSQGIIGLGTEFIGGSWVPFGGSEYKINLSLSYDTKNSDVLIGVEGFSTDIKAGAYTWGTGAGGGMSETKTGIVNIQGGVNTSSFKLVGDATYTPQDKDYKYEETATIGILTQSNIDGNPTTTLGIKDASVNVLILGANAGANITIQKVTMQDNTSSKVNNRLTNIANTGIRDIDKKDNN